MWKEKTLFYFLPFLLLAFLFGCGSSSDDDSPSGVPQSEESRSQVSGKITYDWVPLTSRGLNYEGTIKKPVRKAMIEIFTTNGQQSLASGATDEDGKFSLMIPGGISSVVIVVYAEIKSPSIMVVDNTQEKALYAAFSSVLPVEENTDMDMNIPSGWVGDNETGTYAKSRSAAPFAILDDFYRASKKISEARSDLSFPPLKVNWSVNNINAAGSVEAGQIGTSHFNPKDNQIYILGKEDVDTDEYDAHVIVHEWGHYFEQNLGRADSLGGPHALGEMIDMTLAMSEGWGNALSAMILDPDIIYRDSAGPGQQMTQIEFSLASSPDPWAGWFSEVSVQEILFRLYRARGLQNIVDVMHSYLPGVRAQTSIFSFLKGYKEQNPADEGLVNSLTSRKRISNVQDDFGTGETHSGGFPFALPVYHSLEVGGTPIDVILAGAGFRLNEMMNGRFLRFKASGPSTTLTWKADNTVGVQVFDGARKIYEDSRVSPDGQPVGPVSSVIPTGPGKEYVIRAITDDSLIFDRAQNYRVNFQLQ